MKKQLLTAATLALFSGYVFAAEPMKTDTPKVTATAKTTVSNHGQMTRTAHSSTKHHHKAAAKHDVKPS